MGQRQGKPAPETVEEQPTTPLPPMTPKSKKRRFSFRSSRRYHAETSLTLEDDNAIPNSEIDLYLLGVPQSGKSTFVKQMQAHKFDPEIAFESKDYIQGDVMGALISLAQNYTSVPGSSDAEIEATATKLLSLEEGLLRSSGVFTPSLWFTSEQTRPKFSKKDLESFAQFWANCRIKTAYFERHLYGSSLTDGAAYLLDRLPAILSPDYSPSKKDMIYYHDELRGKISVTVDDFHELGITFKDRGSNFIDSRVLLTEFAVGWNLKKLNKMTPSITPTCRPGVIYFLPLSDYISPMSEDEESSDGVRPTFWWLQFLLTGPTRLPLPVHAPLIVLFTKMDILPAHLALVPFSSVYPSYGGRNTPHNVKEWAIDKISSWNLENPTTFLECDLTNPDSFQQTLQEIIDVFTRHYSQGQGLALF